MEYHLGPRLHDKLPGCLVRIAEDLRKCVVFVGSDVAGPDGDDDIDPVGTGFFVSWGGNLGFNAADKGEIPGIYLVTARHVAQALGSSFVIRFNKKDNGSGIHRIDGASWSYLNEETED